jgi:pimeloyl-ACP methyl ester carboxylesterase
MFLLRSPGGQSPGDVPGSGGYPALGLYLTEPARGLADLVALPLAAAWLPIAPRGDGHGVLVLPGLLASDASTLPLRQFLRWLGYDVHGWELGRNRGPTDDVLDGLPTALSELADATGAPVSVVGWSLGGIYARELGREFPTLVRQVITLGSPFSRAEPGHTRADGVYARGARRHSSGRVPTREEVALPIGVPSTAVYSRHDGIVCWQNCIEAETALHGNVEVRCSHLGYGVDPATLWLIADRLAAPAGEQAPFQPPLLLRALYPSRR